MMCILDTAKLWKMMMKRKIKEDKRHKIKKWGKRDSLRDKCWEKGRATKREMKAETESRWWGPFDEDVIPEQMPAVHWVYLYMCECVWERARERGYMQSSSCCYELITKTDLKRLKMMIEMMVMMMMMMITWWSQQQRLCISAWFHLMQWLF